MLSVHDLVALQPFEGATNRTATVVLQKGTPTDYSKVNYAVWKKTKPGRIEVDLSMAEVEQRTTRTLLSAKPIQATEPTSPWLTASAATLEALQKAVGHSAYQAREGANTGGLNGAYWLRIIERRPYGLLLVENLSDVGKLKVKPVQALVEPDLVYPLLRGRDIDRWKASPSTYILMMQDPVKRTGYDESWLRVTYPYTYAYLKQFEEALRKRSGYKKYFDTTKAAFYSMYDVAEYTFAPFKVLWPWIAAGIRAAVAGQREGKEAVPEHNTSFVPFSDEIEAHYFCSLLNSSPADVLIRARTPGGGGGLASPTILVHVAIPKFDSAHSLHQALATLSKQAHELAARGKEGEMELRQVETEIDKLAARLWGLTDAELAEVQRALEELR